MLKNPFVVYIATFMSAILIYQLGWSEIYPPLSLDFYLFFASTFLAAALLAILVSPTVEKTSKYIPGLLSKYAIWIVVGTFLTELVLAGGIPLFQVLGGAKFYDIEASAIHLHAFLFWSAYSTIRFADYWYSGLRRYLFEASLPILFYLLLVYRGPAIIVLMTWAFIAIIQGLTRAHYIRMTGLAVTALLVNGVLGDIRSPGQESVGAPSKTFQESVVPQTFFWSFLYATLPIANFQLSVDKLSRRQGTIAEFLASEFVPDTISKRILPVLNPNITSDEGNFMSRDQLYSWEQPQVATGLNTSTIFGRAYGFFGWLGPSIMFAFFSCFIVVYLLLIQNSPYRIVCLAWLNTMVIFCLINNMVVSAAMLPPLLLPLVLPPWRSKAFRRPPRQIAQ